MALIPFIAAISSLRARITDVKFETEPIKVTRSATPQVCKFEFTSGANGGRGLAGL